MATARATKQILITGVTLELTHEEARTLLYLCNNVAGDTSNSGRKSIDSIGGALIQADITTVSSATIPLHTGDFMFNPDSNRIFKRVTEQ